MDKLRAKEKKIAAAKRKLNSRFCKLKVAAAAGAGLGAASGLNAMAESPSYKAALEAASEGDEAAVEDAMYDLASEIAQETGDVKLLPAVFGLYYWTKKASEYLKWNHGTF